MKIQTRWLYILLAVLFDLCLVSQISFSIDMVRNWRGEYPGRPLVLGSPWPTVQALTPEARAAGILPKDRVVSVEGRPIRGLQDFEQLIHDRRPGDTLRISVLRDGTPLEFAVPLGPVQTAHNQVIVTMFLMPWLCIALGFWVAAARPRDRLAWMMLGILIGLSQLERPTAVDALGWPSFIGAPTAIFREFTPYAWAASMLLFGFFFPKPGRIERSMPWLKWLVGTPLVFIGLWEAVRAGGFALNYAAAETWPLLPLPNWVALTLLYGSVSLFFTGIGEKYSDSTLALDDRRRLKLLYWGCTLAMLPSALNLVIALVVHHSQPRESVFTVWADMAMVFFPITLAYVIVVQRAMDVRMVIRQGVQYALARRGVRVLQILLVLTVVFISVTILDTATLSKPKKFTLIALGIALVLRIRDFGERVRRWVDRRFFREAFNAEQILGDLSEQVRGILDRDALCETVARKISQSLHINKVAVLLETNGVFRPQFALGYAGSPEIPRDHPAVVELRRTREPLRPQNLDARLLLPLASHKELLGFISLGEKRSEEPYSFTDIALLRTVAAQTGLALENSRLSEAIAVEVTQRELLHREIEIAREVQQRLFPQNLPEVPTLQYAGHCRPAQGVGGDYYDFLALANGDVALVIADVSGKGVPAALLMASLQASTRGQSLSEAGKVAALTASVNRLVCDASPENRYATFFYAQFDPARRRLIYTNGGHNAPMLLRGDEVMRLDAGGPPVGLFRFSKYVQQEIQLQPGDLLVLYTDGISEAENPAQDEWGEDALVATAGACRALPPSETIAHIMQAADAFSAGAPQHDDMTLVIARVV